MELFISAVIPMRTFSMVDQLKRANIFSLICSCICLASLIFFVGLVIYASVVVTKPISIFYQNQRQQSHKKVIDNTMKSFERSQTLKENSNSVEINQILRKSETKRDLISKEAQKIDVKQYATFDPLFNDLKLHQREAKLGEG